MTKLTSLAGRVRLLVNDPDKKRFSDDLLTSAIRQALEQVNLRLPQVLINEFTVATSGREQVLSAISGCLFLVRLVMPGLTPDRELEPDEHFSYTLIDGFPTLHFTGDFIPQAGMVLQVHYATAHTIEGLDDADTTSLPEICEPALVNGAAGCAYTLRAASLVESYGTRPEDASRLLEASRIFLDAFDRMLTGVKTLQDFGYPPGFALDAWDGNGACHANHR